MSTDKDKVLVQLNPLVRRQLQFLKIKMNARSYDEVITRLLKDTGHWDSSLENEFSK